jgi:hypothetical protein
MLTLMTQMVLPMKNKVIELVLMLTLMTQMALPMK